MTRNERRAFRPLGITENVLASERIVHTVVRLLPTVGVLINDTARLCVSIPRVPVLGVGRNQVVQLGCDCELKEDGQRAGERSAECQPFRGQLKHRNHSGSNRQCDQVRPHDFFIYGSAASRRNKRREDRVNESKEARECNAEHVIHFKRPRTQLDLTLRLIRRSGKSFRNNIIARCINPSLSRIHAISAVSRSRRLALTFPLLLLAACAAPHGDDACATPYAGTTHAVRGGRSA